MSMAAEVQIGIRISKALQEKLQEAAARSGWTFSQQGRFQLEHDFGMTKMPYLPQQPNLVPARRKAVRS